MGRFLSRDPYQGNYMHEFNRYVYAMANPVMFSDPSGLASFDLAVAKKWVVTISSQPLRTVMKNIFFGMAGAVVGHVVGSAIYSVARTILDVIRYVANSKLGVPDVFNNIIRYFSQAVSRFDLLVSNVILGGLIGGVSTFLAWRAVKGQDRLIELANHPHAVRGFSSRFRPISDKILNQAFWTGLASSLLVNYAPFLVEFEDKNFVDVVAAGISSVITGVISKQGFHQDFLDGSTRRLRKIAGTLNLPESFVNGGMYAVSNTVASWSSTFISGLDD